MPLAMFDTITPPVPPIDPQRYRIGYDTQTGAIHVTNREGTVIAYLAPRDSLAAAIEICAINAQRTGAPNE